MDKLNRKDDTVSRYLVAPDLVDVEVMGWNILIQAIAVREETDEGLLLADKTVDDMKYLHNVGRVLKMGPECYTDPRNFTVKDEDGKPKPWVEVGDYVVYGKNRGQRVCIKGHNLVLLADNLPLLKIADPSDVDPFYNMMEA